MVKNGLDVLLAKKLKLVKGRKVGIITNPSGVSIGLEMNVDLLLRAGVKVTAIYSPEHGFRGAAKEGEKIESYTDTKTGLPVYSLYGANQKPSAEILKDIEVLIFDLADAGARFYTFISTLLNALAAAKEAGKSLLVLDRPNPINGVAVEGNVLDMKFTSFVGSSPIPIRHGMTMGELALFYNQEMPNRDNPINADLTVVKAEGWQRKMWFDETGLQFIPPSPNMPTPDSALVFPGLCFIEGINVSEGRGTTRPFEWFGAPWIDNEALTEALNKLDLPAVKFRPQYFTPHYSKYKEELCAGVQAHIMDRDKFNAPLIGLYVIKTIHDMYLDKIQWIKYTNYFFDLLLGTDKVRLAIDRNQSLPDILADWKQQVKQFNAIRKKYLIYE
ncbi:MAG: exo-beta-N-acetylmuramidase NamZ domain-containing protein [bacterium]